MEKEKTFYDRLRDMSAQGSGTPATLKRTVYGMKDGEAYQTQDGALYRVRKDRRRSKFTRVPTRPEKLSTRFSQQRRPMWRTVIFT